MIFLLVFYLLLEFLMIENIPKEGLRLLNIQYLTVLIQKFDIFSTTGKEFVLLLLRKKNETNMLRSGRKCCYLSSLIELIKFKIFMSEFCNKRFI